MRRITSVMGLRVRAVAAALAALAAAASAQAAPTNGLAAKGLVAFNSCPALLNYAKSHAAPYVGPYGFGAQTGIGLKGLTPAAPGAVMPVTGAAAASSAAKDSVGSPQQGVDYSGTNIQEAGVDEPDMVKTNGDTLFTVNGNQLEAVDVTGHTPKLLDTLQLTNGGWSQQLLLSGTHLLVLSRGGYWIEPMPAMTARMIAPYQSNSVITEIDVSDPSSMQVMKTLTLDGSYVDARQVGSTVRIVTSSPMPIALPTVTPSAGLSATAAKAKNTTVLEHSRVSSWIPTYRLGKQQPHALVQCRDVLRPVGFSGLGLLTVLTIDLSKGLDPVDSTAVMTDGRIVYASPTTLYVATERWSYRPLPATPTIEPQSNDVQTQISAFDISNPLKTNYLGSGTVPGYLLNQWALSEFQGVLRVVSTDSPAWWGDGGTSTSQSYLTTLRANNGALTQVGQVGGLGQGERVYAVRFIGNDAYVVTFHQVDPLYTLDLSDPAHPQVLGELTIPGYSAYLHPIGDNLLLGIGQDVGANNEPTGTQVSLFDVSDLKNPTRLFHYSLGTGWSAAESDHHAFLYWPATNLVVVPFGQQAVGMKVARASGITELGRIVQTDAGASYLPQIERALVVRDTVLTVSSAGVKSNSLSTFASLGWAAFPAPTPSLVPISPVPKIGMGAATPAAKP
jgi:uncharacterized secreted protein with C-terminal beta-propeller domain